MVGSSFSKNVIFSCVRLFTVMVQKVYVFLIVAYLQQLCVLSFTFLYENNIWIKTKNQLFENYEKYSLFTPGLGQMLPFSDGPKFFFKYRVLKCENYYFQLKLYDSIIRNTNAWARNHTHFAYWGNQYPFITRICVNALIFLSIQTKCGCIEKIHLF